MTLLAVTAMSDMAVTWCDMNVTLRHICQLHADTPFKGKTHSKCNYNVTLNIEYLGLLLELNNKANHWLVLM